MHNFPTQVLLLSGTKNLNGLKESNDPLLQNYFRSDGLAPLQHLPA